VADAPGFPRAAELAPEVMEIADTLERAGFETWAVGGALRDQLLGDRQTDVDLATAAPPEEVQRLFRHTVAVGLQFGTVGVLDRHRRLHEVTTFRRDVETDGRHAVVRFGVSLHEDLARRDFTINAIAYHPHRREWADPFHGLSDLRAGIVRAVGDPEARFREDYLRVLRAIRFAARFGFRIDDATWAAAVAAAAGLATLSAERVREEWFKGLRTARSLRALVGLWHEVGAAVRWLPELTREPVGEDTPEAPRDPVVLTALLCEAPATVLERLRGSNQETRRAAAMAAGPAEPDGEDPVAVRRWLWRVGGAAADLEALARLRRAGAAPWMAVAGEVRARQDPVALSQLAVSGEDLLALGVPPGPGLGALLRRLLELVVEDPSRNTREQLLEAAGRWR
jgi:tRNA nucleotidyltransferase (CCA-adding enzyme)